jgi:hypothetical protein
MEDNTWSGYLSPLVSPGYVVYTDSTIGSGVVSVSFENSGWNLMGNDNKSSKAKEKELTEQEQIDAEVREAIAAPRRKAEVERRTTALEALGFKDAHSVGTVIRWKRKLGKNVYTYAAIKTSEDQWFVTGSKTVRTSGWTWEALTEHMVTGETIAEDVRVASGWEMIY